VPLAMDVSSSYLVSNLEANKTVTDDTNAINAAISAGTRCIPGVCRGSIISPATVYIPSG
jgi:hypothetical protein